MIFIVFSRQAIHVDRRSLDAEMDDAFIVNGNVMVTMIAMMDLMN